jgi:flagellar biogenesis protein FliO
MNKPTLWLALLVVLWTGTSLTAAPAEGVKKPALGVGKSTAAPSDWSPAPDSGKILLRLGIGTAVVLGLCVATLYVGKRWLRPGARVRAAGSQFQVLETLPLGNRCSILLVQAANRQLLVGVDSTGLKSLLSLPEPFKETMPEEPDDLPMDDWASP